MTKSRVFEDGQDYEPPSNLVEEYRGYELLKVPTGYLARQKDDFTFRCNIAGDDIEKARICIDAVIELGERGELNDELGEEEG